MYKKYDLSISVRVNDIIMIASVSVDELIGVGRRGCVEANAFSRIIEGSGARGRCATLPSVTMSTLCLVDRLGVRGPSSSSTRQNYQKMTSG